MESELGKSIIRKEAYEKVTGEAKYTDDLQPLPILHAKILTSPHTHAKIIAIHTDDVFTIPGVRNVITGNYLPKKYGSILGDHPPIAKDVVRYYGEPVALVVADSEQIAMQAIKKIQVTYELLPIVESIEEALKPNAILIHPELMTYQKVVEDVFPIANSNISNLIKIRKGNTDDLWTGCDVVIESSFHLPQSDHVAMETRAAHCQINKDGIVRIFTSSQAPFGVKKSISQHYEIPEGNVVVEVPFVGGGFGGKAPIQIEFLAYLASHSVNGQMVRIVNTREEDIKTSPVKMGLEAYIKLGATKEGKVLSMECSYSVDSGAYTDISPRLAKAIAVDCSGPYHIPNIKCDAKSVFTNHSYATSYRGFSHVCYTFCLERMLEKLAYALKMDSFELRFKNLYQDGDETPTQVKTTLSNIGNLNQCLIQLKTLMNWDEGIKFTENGHIRTKGIACFWKTSDSPTNAISGVTLTFNSDGSLNINCGAVEIGPGMKTTACQLLAEKMRMDTSRIHIKMEVNTDVCPKHWKTVASMTSFMLGRALLRGAEDLIRQLKGLAAIVLKCPPEDLNIEQEKVYVVDRPELNVTFKQLCHGYKYPDGTAVEGQIIGRGSYIMRHLTPLNPETGKGKAGPGWTVGAQGVEIDYDPHIHTYRLVHGYTVIDAGQVINPKLAEGVVMGGMNMGFGLATREELIYDQEGKISNTSLRNYHLLHFGEQPEYHVQFVEEKQINAPYGIRGIGEHGIIGIPAAFANALSTATNLDFTRLPITPETIWQQLGGIK